MPIDQKVTQLPEPPTSTDKVNFRQRADEFLMSLPTLTEELNAFAQQANKLEETVNAAEQDAVAARIVAIAAQNFDGDWDSAKAYKHPVSVRYNGRRYASLQDSTGKQPDVEQLYWMQIDGAGSGLDADLLDGKDSSEFIEKANLLTEIKKIDGAGSGLDADIVRGKDVFLKPFAGLFSPESFNSAYKNNFSFYKEFDNAGFFEVVGSGPYTGIKILKDGIYEVVGVQRGDVDSNAFIGIAVNGDRAILEDRYGTREGPWIHDHSGGTYNYTKSYYYGALYTNEIITCGPSNSTNADALRYSSDPSTYPQAFAGALIIKLVKEL